MATSRSYPLCMVRLVITVLMILIFSLSYLPSKSVGESSSSSYMRRSSAVVVDQLQPRKKVLGSRPPTCVNKCMSCRPCMATLVIPPHRIRTSSITTTTTTQAYQQSSSFHREDDSYYLLSWKCKCGDKLFQP